MGILNRIINLTRSKVDFRHKKNDTFYDDIDDQILKDIIEELNSDYLNTKTDTSSYKQKMDESSQNKRKIPQAVIEAYKVLEVSENATIENIKLNFKKKIKEFHPDVFENSSLKEKEMAKKKTLEILNAYNTIKLHRKF
ncbi:MAG: DnaJ domain-containing protein [Ignavibacteria bacterium]|jgi:DnaJ like chaperone protein|nr:DnaJ domain-containing protein [Ignavibacteria bacterium]